MTARRPPPPPMAYDVAANSRQWTEALARMDASRRLTPREQNKLLDQIAVSKDAERAAALAALQHRLEQARRGGR
jgi:hypothetical protein